MTAIEIDFDVFKALTLRRESEATTYNDVLRKMLGLPDLPSAPSSWQGGWTWKGVTLPDNTELRAQHKGRQYTARIENGEWIQDGQTQRSPSAAAYLITQSGINGWSFWQVKRPGDLDWQPLENLRPKNTR